jgi:N-acetylmuramoyl-L-alanine amidase
MSKINLVIGYSQQAHNACKMGDNEQTHMQPIAEALYDILSGDRRLNTYLMPLQNTGTDSGNLKASIALSNKFIKANGGKGYHIELHSDAGGGKGAVGLYVSETGKRLVSALMGALDDITPAADEDRIRYRDNLGALNQTLAVAGIIEVSFHDKPDEAKWIHENSVSIAVAIAYGFYKFMKGEKLI